MRLKIFILFALTLFVCFSSCKKAKENKLTGSWRLLPQTAVNQYDTVIYTFDAGNVLYRTVNDTGFDTANYILDADFTKYFLTISELDPYSDATYFLEKLNNKVLILQCQSPYMRKEFVKYVN